MGWDLAVNEGLHSRMEHALRFLSFGNKGSRELGVETAASLLEKLESFQCGGGLPGGNVGL